MAANQLRRDANALLKQAGRSHIDRFAWLMSPVTAEWIALLLTDSGEPAFPSTNAVSGGEFLDLPVLLTEWPDGGICLIRRLGTFKIPE
jgi:hypothetical protein